MNEIFSFNRFWRFFRADVENARARYGLNVIVFALLPIIHFLVRIAFGLIINRGVFADIDFPGFTERMSVFAVATIGIVITFPSRIYGILLDKRQGPGYFLMPASGLEKFASMMAISLVVVPALYFGLYMLSDKLLTMMFPQLGTAIVSNTTIAPGIKTVELTGNGFFLAWSVWCGAVLTFLFGALIFEKHSIGKTILCLFALSIILGMLISWIVVAVEDSDWFYEMGYRLEGWSEAKAVRTADLLTSLWNMVEICGLGALCFWRIKTIKH